jgi:hypothetical protein
MIENLKHAVFQKENVVVGGGLFWPDEVEDFVQLFERNARIAALAEKALPFMESNPRAFEDLIKEFSS